MSGRSALPCGCIVSAKEKRFLFLKCETHEKVDRKGRVYRLAPWSHILAEEIERLRDALDDR